MQDKALNRRLKKMWRIHEEMLADRRVEIHDMIFFNNHLKEIKEYYIKNSKLWANITPFYEKKDA
jgi:hypothetical protein